MIGESVSQVWTSYLRVKCGRRLFFPPIGCVVWEAELTSKRGLET